MGWCGCGWQMRVFAGDEWLMWLVGGPSCLKYLCNTVLNGIYYTRDAYVLRDASVRDVL